MTPEFFEHFCWAKVFETEDAKNGPTSMASTAIHCFNCEKSKGRLEFPKNLGIRYPQIIHHSISPRIPQIILFNILQIPLKVHELPALMRNLGGCETCCPSLAARDVLRGWATASRTEWGDGATF